MNSAIGLLHILPWHTKRIRFIFSVVVDSVRLTVCSFPVHSFGLCWSQDKYTKDMGIHVLPVCGRQFDRSAVRDAIAAFPLPPVCTAAGAPVRGTSADAWNIAVRTRGVFTHRAGFQKPACAERGLVRTGTAPIISESAVIWTFRAIIPATVGREESHGQAPRSARSIAAGDRSFRLRCRLNSPACCSRQARYYRHFTCRR